MALIDKKITDEQIAQIGVTSAPDTLTGSAPENKAIFDRLPAEIVKRTVNPVIDELVSADGARNIGISPIAGQTNVQDILDVYAGAIPDFDPGEEWDIRRGVPGILSVNLTADGWQPMTPEEIAATDPALAVKQAVTIPDLTVTKQVDIVRVPVAYEEDGQPSLYPYNLSGVCIICAAEAPTVDVDIILSVQEVVAL